MLVRAFLFRTHTISFPFFCTHTATSEIYTLSLHDALPIFTSFSFEGVNQAIEREVSPTAILDALRNPLKIGDRKSTRLNSSHRTISYAVFCLKKKNIAALRRAHDVTMSTRYADVEGSPLIA